MTVFRVPLSDAVERALSLSPSVVVMDLALPGMDGLEAIRILKGDDRTRSSAIIALTGRTSAGYAESAEDVDAVAAHDPAADAVADHDYVTPHRLAKDKVVKCGHAIQVGRGHAQVGSNVAKALIGDPAAVPLHDP